MTETDQKLAESVETVLAWMEQGKDFATEQAPLLAQEIIRYEIFLSLFLGGLMLVALLASCWMAWQIKKRWKEVYDNDLEPLLFVPAVIGGASFFSVVVNTAHLIRAIIAPRLVIIDALKDLL